MQARGFRSLKGRKEIDGIRPPVRVDGSSLKSKRLERPNNGAETGDDFRLAIVEKAVGDEGEASKAASRCDLGWRKRRGQQRRGKKRRGKMRSVFEIAEEPAHGIERFGEVSAAAPIAAAVRGAITGEPT